MHSLFVPCERQPKLLTPLWLQPPYVIPQGDVLRGAHVFTTQRSSHEKRGKDASVALWLRNTKIRLRYKKMNQARNPNLFAFMALCVCIRICVQAHIHARICPCNQMRTIIEYASKNSFIKSIC